jgi:hypothetical protein
LFGAQLPRAERSAVLVGTQSKRAFQRSLLAVSLFAFIAALPWLAKNIAAPRYADQSRTTLGSKIASLSNASTMDAIHSFAAQPEAFMQFGRVLYPRFFSKKDGLASANPWPAYALRDYPRVGFLLLNQSSHFVVFPTKRLPAFPHARDAIVLGCLREDYVEAHWIIFPELDSVYSNEELPESCSP